MKRNLIVLGFAVLAALTISGCLLTIQKTFIEDINIGQTTNDNVAGYWVDLYTNPDYADNIDKIKSVDVVSFVARIINQGAAANQAVLYISADTIDIDGNNAADSIETYATKVFVSPAIAAGDTLLITWNVSHKYIQNESVLKDYVMNRGRFWVYGIADDLPFSLRVTGQIVVTVTAGK